MVQKSDGKKYYAHKYHVTAPPVCSVCTHDIEITINFAKDLILITFAKCFKRFTNTVHPHLTKVRTFWFTTSQEAALKNREAAIAVAIRKNKRIAAAQAKKQQQSTPAAPTSGSSSPGGPLTPPDSNRKLNEVPSNSSSRMLTTVVDAGSAATVAVSDADVAAVGLAVDEADLQQQHHQPTVYWTFCGWDARTLPPDNNKT